MSNNKHLVVATVRDKKGRVLARRANNYTKTHPIQAHFAAKAGKPDAVFLHAEIAALLACGTQIPFSIYVERYKRDGTPGLAKPCIVCQAALKAWNVQKVKWTV